MLIPLISLLSIYSSCIRQLAKVLPYPENGMMAMTMETGRCLHPVRMDVIEVYMASAMTVPGVGHREVARAL